jgi:hypothetical protein
VTADDTNIDDPVRELAVHRLLHRYVAAVDAQDVDAIRVCFGANGSMALRGVERTGDELADFYRARLAFPTLHLITGITIADRPDGLVVAGCGLFAIEMPDDGWRAVSGRYDDVIRIDGGTATFVRREITIAGRVRLSPER